jgi:glycopeptide antibiotics resistance protein
VKSLSKILLALYLLTLLWLVLFKFSVHVPSVFDQARSLNLIPFANYSRGNVRELIYNFAVFIPFGLFLSVNFKRTSFWQKLAFIFIFSLSAEIIQLVFAIGAADITDVISNTSGGLLGLVLYDLTNKYVDNEKLDRLIVIAGTISLVLSISILGALFYGGVRFQKPAPGGVHRLPRM